MTAPSLGEFIHSHIPMSDAQWTGKQHDWAWANYKETVRNLIRHSSARSVAEIGGGRRPLFRREEIDEIGVAFAVNDISQRELDRAPTWLHKSCFDIAGPVVPDGEEGRYDLVTSKMVMEHVRHGEQAYRNIYRMLKPGGVFFNFHPVLYSPPFVLNWVLPERASQKVLSTIFPVRKDDGIPKFPAHYSFCVISDRTEGMLSSIGFTEVALLPIYGHRYFRKIPLLREADAALTGYARDRAWRKLASYCYALGRK